MAKIDPTKPAPPTVPMVPLENLQAAIARSKQLIAEHKAIRPDNLDIPAITIWAQHKETLECGLTMLEQQEAVRWRDVPVPGGRPAQPTPAPAPVPDRATPAPAPVQARPTPAATPPARRPAILPPLKRERHTNQSPRALVEERVAKAWVAFAEAQTCRTLEEFLKKRQRVQQHRYLIQKTCRTYGLALPDMPESPANRFPLGKPGRKPKTQEVEHV
ncbi:hypothetical protein [Geothrix sp. 21YS21S-2]|uniref:hypothetical protein n=1 Tax=Geothrix sp. 21YS21S-2 TaxID=3068893 RepID=UPI0027B8FA47|nr:hypothetical protein [Geothrix sp. 21YS21S-2]